jgi:glycosyltransferase involved in cell wall biosynthesis
VTPSLVSTIIPVYNRPGMLRIAVESVLSQTHRPIEILIADDGSTDSTPDVAKQLVQQHPREIIYVRHDNSGPGPTRELGRQRACGEFIQYLDSDDRLLPNKFQDQIGLLRQHPECDIAYGLTRLIEQDGEVLAAPFKWTGRDISRLFPGLLVDRWWCTHTPLYRRSLTDRIGPWCDMRWSQDWEYDARAGALGAKLVRCQTYVSEHCHHSGERQTSAADWTTSPERIRNRVALLSSLWKNAVLANVNESAPERQHFARWAFAIARQAAAAGLDAEMTTCLSLAQHAAGPTGAGRHGLWLFQALTKVLGTRLGGHVARLGESFRPGAGSSTMDQSFS